MCKSKVFNVSNRAPVAQWIRASVFETGGRGSESHQAHHYSPGSYSFLQSFLPSVLTRRLLLYWAISLAVKTIAGDVVLDYRILAGSSPTTGARQ